jgi:cytochrome c biogenesis protein CcmG/thiol:disulfide interchange protein DsbE
VLIVTAVPASLVVRRAVTGKERIDPLTAGSAPAFTLRSLDGATVSLERLRGRPVVINFWGSWCKPCREVLSMLGPSTQRHPEVVVLGVLFRDRPAEAEQAAREAGAGWPMLFDPDERVARAYGVNGAPLTFFINAQGSIAGHLIGPVTRPTVEREFKKITLPS